MSMAKHSHGCSWMRSHGNGHLERLIDQDQTRWQSLYEVHSLARSRTSLERLHHVLGEDLKQINCVGGGDVVETITPANVVVLSFPPGELNAVFTGVSYDQFANVLQTDRKAGPVHHVLRVIPSIGAKINDSVTLIAETACAGHEQQMVTAWMFEQLGQLQWLPESLMDEATAAVAASNALTMVVIDAIVDASVAEGIPRSAALKLAAASLRSSSGLLLGGGMTPESLKESGAQGYYN